MGGVAEETVRRQVWIADLRVLEVSWYRWYPAGVAA
jgi:hypothetical protein